MLNVSERMGTQSVRGNDSRGERIWLREAAGLPAICQQERKTNGNCCPETGHPQSRLPVTHAFTAGLRLGGAGSCLTMGETMAGWGIPEVGRPGWAGATM